MGKPTGERRRIDKENSLRAAKRIVDAVTEFPKSATGKERTLAFKLALPGLGSVPEIKDFIEHVAQGIALGMFNGREGSQLLYAAQIALGAAKEKCSKLDRTGPKKKRTMQPEKKKR
jgi:hypothetical protein